MSFISKCFGFCALINMTLNMSDLESALLNDNKYFDHSTLKIKKALQKINYKANAEKEGFEPPVPCGTLVFKTSAFDHSAISPVVQI